MTPEQRELAWGCAATVVPLLLVLLLVLLAWAILWRT